MNSVTRTPLRVRHETRLRHVQVVRVETLSPRMRRIVFGGEALDGFASAAADDHVKLFFTVPGQQTPEARDYTPRRFDAAALELTIDFVLHGDGPAASWAAQAKPGQWLDIGGPRGSFLIPEDFDAYLLAGDETALPAISRRLEEMRPGARAIVIIEVADAAEERHLPTAANASILWLHRNLVPAGAGCALEAALESIALPAGDIHAWLAGEIETVRRLRTHLIEDRRFPRAHVRAAGYWRIGQANAHARLDD